MASIFTQIIDGELPAHKVYESERELAFLDIHPYSEGHTLVVPKLEVASFEELPPDAAQSLVVTLQKVARGVQQAMGTPHYNLSCNNGSAAGQVVFHVHFHIIPRYEHQSKLSRDKPGDDEMERIAARIRDAIAAG